MGEGEGEAMVNGRNMTGEGGRALKCTLEEPRLRSQCTRTALHECVRSEYVRHFELRGRYIYIYIYICIYIYYITFDFH